MVLLFVEIPVFVSSCPSPRLPKRTMKFAEPLLLSPSCLEIPSGHLHLEVANCLQPLDLDDEDDSDPSGRPAVSGERVSNIIWTMQGLRETGGLRPLAPLVILPVMTWLPVASISTARLFARLVCAACGLISSLFGLRKCVLALEPCRYATRGKTLSQWVMGW